MKPVSIIVGALAAFATAAPTKEVEQRGVADLSLLNNLQFSNLNFGYLSVVNNVDLALLQSLSVNNNLNLALFQNLFQSQVFNFQAALQFQQLQQTLQFAQLGLFNGIDLSSLALGNLNFGLINGLSGFDFNSVIDQSLLPQINAVVSGAGGESFSLSLSL